MADEIGGRELTDSGRYTIEVPEEMLTCLLEHCYPKDRYPTVDSVQAGLLRAVEERCALERAASHIEVRRLLIELDEEGDVRAAPDDGQHSPDS